jgi:hypothetical protein
MIAPADVKPFFERYAEASLTAEPAVLARMYAPTFLVAGPTGSATFANDPRFLEWLAGVRELNQRHGMRALEVVELTSLPLSPLHLLTTVRWGARFARTGDRRIDFQIAYLVELAPAGPQILAYVSETDQEDEMRRAGLLE